MGWKTFEVVCNMRSVQKERNARAILTCFRPRRCSSRARQDEQIMNRKRLLFCSVHWIYSNSPFTRLVLVDTSSELLSSPRQSESHSSSPVPSDSTPRPAQWDNDWEAVATDEELRVWRAETGTTGPRVQYRFPSTLSSFRKATTTEVIFF
jgi:hypothetical protein